LAQAIFDEGLSFSFTLQLLRYLGSYSLLPSHGSCRWTLRVHRVAALFVVRSAGEAFADGSHEQFL
jgi:hypothetical protein